MGDARFARTLLRLYPPAWRARYGDEFLALVADSGRLSWRAAADIVGAAAGERARSIASLIRNDGAPVDLTEPSIRLGPDRGWFAYQGLFFVLVAATVWVLHAAGLEAPRWTFWLFLAQFSLTRATDPIADPTHWSWVERALASFWWWATALVLSGVSYYAGVLLNRAGVAAPSDGTVVSVLLGLIAALGARTIYCAIRLHGRRRDWPGIRAGEKHAWNAAVLLIVIAGGLSDPSSTGIWMGSQILWMTLRPSFGWTRVNVARRRAIEDAIASRTARLSSDFPVMTIWEPVRRKRSDKDSWW
jgi:hypothetical protein